MKIFSLALLAINTSLASLSPSPASSLSAPSPALPPLPLSSSPSPTASATTPAAAATPPPSPTDPLNIHHHPGQNEPALRTKTMELAGAFSNDGYKIRDGFWLSLLPPIGKTSLLTINLIAGNQYWFCAASAPPAKRIALKLYNENGHLVSTQPYEHDTTAALGVEPSNSGKYYLSIQLVEGSPANVCVLYTYK